jgi:hypothetical protein
VTFYEILAPGFHSPLTKTQIAELFHAGRLGRDHSCRQIAHKEWRTIDELFPLLKYQSSGSATYEPERLSAPAPRLWIVVFLLLAVAAAGALLWSRYADRPAASRLSITETTRRWPHTISIQAPPAPTVVAQRPIDYGVTVTPSVTVEAYRQPARAQQPQLAQERAVAEERQRDEAERDRLRSKAQQLEQKAEGQDLIIPLDQQTIVNIGGVSVTVKIHDNDVTSFDFWINGSWHREVPKRKGITQSRTDETLIYTSGRARLYYVWELSGKLNHCRLRVRED